MATAAAITIDVDSLHHYADIHGLDRGEPGDDPIYNIALDRFFELLDRHHCPSTLFLIAQDVAGYEDAIVRGVGATDSEVASHSFSHDYQLTRRSRDEIAEDLRRADEVLRPLNADRPLAGFRAPGYNVTADLLEAVQDLGYCYDSSLLPSPQYYAARAAVIRAYRLLGRTSRSIPGTLRQFWGPLEPYHMRAEQPWKPASDGALLELPMACEPLSRVPVFGTSLALLGSSAARRLVARTLEKLDTFVFEMHAIDLLDANDHPRLKELSKHQRDLRVPVGQKVARFTELFDTLTRGTEVLTLHAIAQRELM